MEDEEENYICDLYKNIYKKVYGNFEKFSRATILKCYFKFCKKSYLNKLFYILNFEMSYFNIYSFRNVLDILIPIKFI